MADFDEAWELTRAQWRARFLSIRLGRRVQLPMGNVDGLNAHWIHEPLRWADNGQPIGGVLT